MHKLTFLHSIAIGIHLSWQNADTELGSNSSIEENGDDDDDDDCDGDGDGVGTTPAENSCSVNSLCLSETQSYTFEPSTLCRR